jgi:hypothetical protein
LNNAPDQLISHYDLDRYKVNELFDSSKVSFIEDMDASTAISKKNPSFVVGWGSTSLCEALNMGVLPINFLDLSDGVHKDVYPVSDMSLKWPDDRRIIEGLITRKYNYDDVVKSLRNVGRSVFISSKTL